MVSKSNPLWSIRKSSHVFGKRRPETTPKKHKKKKHEPRVALDEWMGCLEIWHVYIYTWNPNDLYSWWSTPQQKGLFEPKEGSFGFQVYIYISFTRTTQDHPNLFHVCGTHQSGDSNTARIIIELGYLWVYIPASSKKCWLDNLKGWWFFFHPFSTLWKIHWLVVSTHLKKY